MSVPISLSVAFIDEHGDRLFRQIDMEIPHLRSKWQLCTLASRYIHDRYIWIGIDFKFHYHQQLLEVEDLCDSARPDERSVMTYIASYFHAFSTMGETIEYYVQTTLTWFTSQ